MLGAALLAGGAALAADFYATLNQVEEQSENVRQAADRFRASAAVSIEAGRPLALSALEADADALRKELVRMENQLERLEAVPAVEVVPTEDPAR